MKILGGILGILGGLLSVGGCVFLVALGATDGVSPETGGISSDMGAGGGVAAVACIVLGVIILLGGRWLAGAFLLASALIAMLVVGVWLAGPAIAGGVLAIMHGHRRLTPDEVQQRLEADRRRLELELQRGSRA
jgi:hypothetical protein